jgi:two-component system LytT family response regulator
MLKTIIVEDEPKNAEILQYFIQKYCPELQLLGTAENIEDAINLIQKHTPDLVFLDIVLKDKLVFDLFEHITHKNFQVIFTTAFEQYAIQAFKYNALDYLLKPIDIDELQEAVQKAIDKKNTSTPLSIDLLKNLQLTLERKQAENETIAVFSNYEVILIQEQDIVYCSSKGQYSILHLKNGVEHVSSKNLGAYQKVLNPKKFFRIHHSYIINLSHLRRIDKTKDNHCTLSDGTVLPIARRRREGLFNLFDF